LSESALAGAVFTVLHVVQPSAHAATGDRAVLDRHFGVEQSVDLPAPTDRARTTRCNRRITRDPHRDAWLNAARAASSGGGARRARRPCEAGAGASRATRSRRATHSRRATRAARAIA